ncbi:MAG: hypothetical protein MJ241_04060 [Bacilli bacterium]|nr:hypothetical protein [Bacilli bacterium]
MVITDKCPECSAALEEKREGSALTYICSKCGWSVATTDFEPIDLDQTVYSITLIDGNVPSKRKLSALSKITGKNFIECSTLIKTNGVVMSGKARKVIEYRDILNDAELKFDINPHFKY